MSTYHYQYQIVDGTTVLTKPDTLAWSKRALKSMHNLNEKPIEIERVTVLDNGERIYWRWRGEKWGYWQARPSEDDLNHWRED